MKASKATVSVADEQYLSDKRENSRHIGSMAANDASSGVIFDVSTSEHMASTSLHIEMARALQARSIVVRHNAQKLMEHSSMLRNRFPSR